jgi:hypothetical protein
MKRIFASGLIVAFGSTPHAQTIVKPGVSIRTVSATLTENIRLEKGILEFTVSKPALLKIEGFDVKGNLRKKELLPDAKAGAYHLDIATPHSPRNRPVA